MALNSENAPPLADESRRYRILEVVGEGGFGKVYRATLEGAEGFAKDVAIKLLSDDDAPEIVLQRFRDESRILGLVRDRAIVTVDPPTRLEGRWAVVMEFVDGTNCQRLMKAAPFPPRTALEVIQEVARALDNVYTQVGPDGNPLRLVHRDIKPGNIQLTPAGTVKVLDFGIARAEFATRESKTTTHIGGTFGYIAPERLTGEEGPASDVYSLGVVLMALVAGRRTTTKNRKKIMEWVEQDEDVKKVFALGKEMTQVDPDDRPTAREVEDRCGVLSREVRGAPLRRWAETNVQSFRDLEPDLLIGNVLTETMANLPRFSETAELSMLHRRPRRARFGIALLLVAVLVLGLGGLGLAGVVGFLLANRTPEPARFNAPVVVTVPAQPTAPVPVPVPIPEPLGPENGPETPPVEPEPVPVEVKPRPKPEAVLFPVSFGSNPVGARIQIDGRSLGSKPVFNHPLTQGKHTLKMSFPDGRSATKRIRVGPDEPKRFIWKGGDAWSVFY